MNATRVRRRTVLAGLAGAAAAPGAARAQAGGATTSHGIAIHGDPALPPDVKHLAYVNPDAPKGGTARLGVRGTFDSLNPFIVKGVPAAGLSQIYQTLLQGVGDEASTEYGSLAESIETPADRSWATFTLRAEARWHDGKPITPEDVVFSLDILKTTGSPSYACYYQDVLKAEIVGERKVKFTFRDANNRELPVIVGQLAVLPKHWWAT
ncbi:MAG: ABC transporter substrate-binding protein, partial [Rhodospirillales bacterium]|nr:ABC transporter substrate-binding protein [Rhodospirillales bacterium]